MFVAGHPVTLNRIGAAICYWGVLGCGLGTFSARWISGPNKAIETISASGAFGALLGSEKLQINTVLNIVLGVVRRALGVEKDDDEPRKDGQQTNPG